MWALVVDDISINAKILLRLLQEKGLQVETAENGQIAVDKAKAAIDRPYDIIFMDLMMPVMDGLTATRLIKELPAYEKVPIIAVTANAARGVNLDARDAGVVEFVLKPIEADQIGRLLEKYLADKMSPSAKEREQVITAIAEENNVIKLPGINYEQAKRRLGCDDEMMHELVADFYNRYRSFSVELDKALIGDAGDNPVRLVHNLAGVAANIGADDLGAVARELEQALKADNWNLVCQYRIKLQRVIAPLLKALNRFAVTPTMKNNNDKAGDDGKPHVLLIEDDDSSAKVIFDTLRKEGYAVHREINGKAGLDYFNSNRVDIVLLDIILPLLDGYDLCKRIKANHKTAYIPVIFVTKLSDPEAIMKGFECGGQDYVQKPVKLFELLARVKAHVTVKLAQDKMLLLNEELNEANRIVRDQNQQLGETVNELEVASITDALTGLNNRRFIYSKLGESASLAVRGKVPFAVVMADIDFFKNVNDSYGHDGGDYVLREVASILQGELRKSDYAARWGGEEFLLLLNNGSLDDARNCAERIRNRIANQQFDFNDNSFKVTMSFGVAEWHGNCVDDVVSEADGNLYLAKRSGRNRVEG